MYFRFKEQLRDHSSDVASGDAIATEMLCAKERYAAKLSMSSILPFFIRDREQTFVSRNLPLLLSNTRGAYRVHIHRLFIFRMLKTQNMSSGRSSLLGDYRGPKPPSCATFFGIPLRSVAYLPLLLSSVLAEATFRKADSTLVISPSRLVSLPKW